MNQQSEMRTPQQRPGTRVERPKRVGLVKPDVPDSTGGCAEVQVAEETDGCSGAKQTGAERERASVPNLIDGDYPGDGRCRHCGEQLDHLFDELFEWDHHVVHHEEYECAGCGTAYFMKWSEPRDTMTQEQSPDADSFVE